MDSTAKTFLSTLTTAGIAVHLFVKYVDDLNIVAGKVKLGMEWTEDKKSLVHNAEKEMKDNESSMSEEKKTFEIIHEAANNIQEYLKFTVDVPENHVSGRCPMLDLETWIEEREDQEGARYSQDMYSYYI